MAQVKPLALRRQKSSTSYARNIGVPEEALQAEVLVDTDIYHLEQSFTYLVPKELTDLSIGSIVKVPFKGETVKGVVAEISRATKTNLLSIISVLQERILTKNHFDFAQLVAARYACNYPSVVHAFLNGFDAKKVFESTRPELEPSGVNRVKRSYVDASSFSRLQTYLSDKVKSASSGSLLIVFPDQSQLDVFTDLNRESTGGRLVEFGSHLPATKKKLEYARIVSESNLIIAGLRSSIFTPIRDLTEIIVVDEFSSNYFEQRVPFWNLRDLALLRSESDKCDITFVGTSCSLELARLIDAGWVKTVEISKVARNRPGRTSFYPDSFHGVIREGLRSGPVLVCVSSKEYASGFVCANCRNRASCKCGGYLKIVEKGRAECTTCDFQSSDWRCLECGNNRSLIFKSGAKKLLEEIGKAFPREAIRISTADKPLHSMDEYTGIVVATYGSEPDLKGGYGAVVLLDGEFLTSRPLVRAEEETFHKFMKSLAKLQSKGSVFISLFAKHPISQAISSGKNSFFFQTALRERQETSLPPYIRVIRISGEARSISSLRMKLMQQFPETLEAFLSHSGMVLTLKVKHDSVSAVLAALKALQKLRSTTNKQLFRIQVDPLEF